MTGTGISGTIIESTDGLSFSSGDSAAAVTRPSAPTCNTSALPGTRYSPRSPPPPQKKKVRRNHQLFDGPHSSLWAGDDGGVAGNIGMAQIFRRLINVSLVLL
jgi:hypothetical protein